MGLFSSVCGFIGGAVKSVGSAIAGGISGLFGGGSSGGGYSGGSSTVYEPDKVRVAEIEADTKVRLAKMETERIEVYKQARLDILEFETKSQIALEQAKAQGFAIVAQTIIAMQEKMNEIAEKRLQIIEHGSLQLVKEVETFYEQIGDKIQADNDEYNCKKLPALLDILQKYEKGTPQHELYFQRIVDDSKIQQQHFMKQLDAVLARQNMVITGIMESKNKMIEQTGTIMQDIAKQLAAEHIASTNRLMAPKEQSPALPKLDPPALALPESASGNNPR